MSDDDEQKNLVLSLFSKNVDVSVVPSYFFLQETNEMRIWKNKATIYTLQQLDLQYNEDRGDGDMMHGYDDIQESIDRGSILKDAYANYVNGLSSCTPLFAHLYIDGINPHKLKWDCWCPCSNALNGWRVTNKLTFLANHQCQFCHSVKLPVFLGHLKSKAGSQHIDKGASFDNTKNCFLHTLTLKWLDHYASNFHIKIAKKSNHDSTPATKNNAPIDAYSRHSANTPTSVTTTFDPRWQTRISQNSNPGQLLYIHPVKPHTWVRPHDYDINNDRNRPSNSVSSYQGSEVTYKSDDELSEIAVNNKSILITVKKDQTEQLELLKKELNEKYDNLAQNNLEDAKKKK